MLLDTCAVIYLFNGEVILPDAVEAIDNAASVLVSPISAWEIGILGRKQNRNALEFLPNRLILAYARPGHIDAIAC